MVGVQKKNKCFNCRKRKIRCDGARPNCGQCRRSVINCEGFPILRFIHGTSSIHERPDGLSLPTYESSGTTNGRSSMVFGDPSSRYSNSHPATAGRREDSSGIVAYNCSVGTGRAPNTVSLHSPLRSHSWAHSPLVEEFVDNCIPGTRSRHCTLSWLRDTMVMMKDSEAIQLALSALATGWAGRVEARPDLVDKGLQMYGAAAHQFGREITKGRPSQTLVTTSILMTYELFEFGSGGNSCWTYHISGAAASMCALEPGELSVSPYCDILSLFRGTLMINSFRAGETTLAAPPAISAPSSYSSGFQGLVDLGIETARLLKEAGATREGRQLPLPTLRQLNQQLRRLSQWGDAHGATPQSGSLLVERRPAETSRSGIGLRAFPRRVSASDIGLYDALHDMRVMRIYWTLKLTLLMVNQHIWAQLDDAESSFHTAHNEQAQRPALAQEADELARSIRCHFQVDSACRNLWPSFGDMLEMWSLETASRWYKEYASESDADVDLDPTSRLSSHNQPGLEHCQTLRREMELQMGHVNTLH